MHGLFGYYGPPSHSSYLTNMFSIRFNYLTFLTLILIVFCLLLFKMVHYWEGHTILDLIFDLLSQSFGHTRNRIHAEASAKILLIAVFFLCYIFWSVNCAMLYSILTSPKIETINSYAELNASNRIVYISDSTNLRYKDANVIEWF